MTDHAADQELELDVNLADAEPVGDDIDRQWVKARAANALFSSAAEPAPVVGRFELGDRLGVGGMGVVYSAHDPELDREVAVKLVRVNASRLRDETLAEAQSLARLTHPNIVAVHDVGIVDDQVYIVMEFVRGETLRAHAAQAGRTRYDVVAAYRQAADGLAAAHAEGLIHRDFKPDNALIGDDGRVRVIDFGLAHAADSDAARPSAGTPKYMAPEQARGEPLTAAADQYALCASLAEALHAACGDDVPAWLGAITSRGTSDEAAERFADFDALGAALARDPRQIWKRRAVVGVAAIAVAGAFAVGSTVFASETSVDPCTGGPALIDAAWTADARATALARIRDSGNYGAGLAPLLATQFDAFGESWADSHLGACLAHERGEQSAELLDRQMACLDRGKRAIAAAAAIVEKAEASDFANLAVVAQSLPSPESCTNITALTAVDPPPIAVAAEVADLFEELEEINIVHAAGRYKEVLAATRALATQVEATNYYPLIAANKLLEGRALLSSWELEEAILPLERATELAILGGVDDLSIEAWARRAWAEGTGTESQSATEGRRYFELMATRLGDDTFSTGLLYNNLGSLEIAAGNREAARAMFAKAARVSRSIDGPGALELVMAVVNLAVATDDEAERDRLATDAIEALTNRLGPTHPEVLDAAVIRATLTPSAEGGIAILEPTCRLILDNHPSLERAVRQCFVQLAWFAALGEDNAAATKAMKTAARHGSDAIHVALAAVWHEPTSAGLRALEELLDGDELTSSSWWIALKRSEVQMSLGRGYRRMGRDAQGKKHLAEAIELLEAIADPVPAIERQVRLARKWLSDELRR